VTKGKPWSPEDEKLLRNYFDFTKDLRVIAFNFDGKYTEEAIRQKLIKLGLLKEEQQETWKALKKIRTQYHAVDVHVNEKTDYDDVMRRVRGEDNLIIIEEDGFFKSSLDDLPCQLSVDRIMLQMYLLSVL